MFWSGLLMPSFLVGARIQADNKRQRKEFPGSLGSNHLLSGLSPALICIELLQGKAADYDQAKSSKTGCGRS